ncbi:hypothetical protein [Cereibacter sphaeroides]|uniref:hypothetical protein n=1 Tax=Cereibacter sphaeroides TaxID=1063 RepID=UPI001F2A074A|nr:hypothetical protein [Cereibacter sphaeroides]
MRLLLSLALLFLTGHAAHSLEFREMTVPVDGSYDHTTLFLSGPIGPGDSDAFRRIADKYANATITLDSPGGNVTEALSIGAEIRIRNFATMVLPQVECHSACALLWLSGARRYMSETSVIGFHAAYIHGANGEARESGMVNAEIGSFLAHLGYNKHVIRFATLAGPESTLRLTPGTARALGVDLFLQDRIDVKTPDEIPTAPTLAARFVELAYLQNFCADLIDLDVAHIESEARDAHAQGNALAGNDLWMDFFITEVEITKSRSQTMTLPELCIHVADELRSASIDLGISGPSFDCSMARSNAEHGICDHESLWARDKLSSKLYAFVRQGSPDGHILNNQREWLRGRDSCGYDADCLVRTYDNRIRQFGTAIFSD